MRLKIVLIMWIGMALFSCNVMGTNYRAVYDFEYTKDSINSIIEKDILYLEIAEKGSFCFSYYTYYSDSLWNTPQWTGRLGTTLLGRHREGWHQCDFFSL